MSSSKKYPNGLGIAGFIMALIGFVLSWIPVVNIVGAIVCGTAFLMSFIALLLRRRRKGLAVVGLLLAIAGLVVFVVEWGAITGVITM